MEQMSCWQEYVEEIGHWCPATGGETADVGDLVRTIIVDSTCHLPHETFGRNR